MSVSENIRALSRKGLGTAEIARQLGIRYQHAYNVLKSSDMLLTSGRGTPMAVDTPSRFPKAPKSPLSVQELVRAGFELSGRWFLSDSGELAIDRPLPSAAGVYAFAKDGTVVYLGLATMGLAKRLYYYGKPGSTQRTNLRINAILKNELLTTPSIEILTATPADLEWNGLPVHGSAGLELGLIKKYALPWNTRSAN